MRFAATDETRADRVRPQAMNVGSVVAFETHVRGGANVVR
jgi:hypothetical protein